MRFLQFALLFASLAAVAFTWAAEIERAVYNKWHQTELEKWLQDHSIPYPAAADRRDLQNLVQQHWHDFTSAKIFQDWPDNRLAEFLRAETGTLPDQVVFDNEKPGLTKQLEAFWSDRLNRLPTEKWDNAKTWVFDSWSDSQLQQFLQHHGFVKDLTPTTCREKLIKAAKDHYDEIAKKLSSSGSGSGSGSGDSVDSEENNNHSWYSFYPGDWLYASWSDSDLRNWLIEHGWIDKDDKSATTTSRDNLLLYMRKSWLYTTILSEWKSFEKTTSSAGSKIATTARSYRDAAEASVAAASREAAKEASILSSRSRRESLSSSSSASKALAEASRTIASLESQIIGSWSTDQLRSWAVENDIPVPHGIQQKELQAMVRKHRDKLSKQAMLAVNVATQTVESAYGAATSSAGNGFAEATHAAASYLRGAAERLKDVFGGSSTSSAHLPTQIGRFDL